MEPIHAVQTVSALVGGALFAASAYFSRRSVRPTWDTSQWKPIWKMRNTLPRIGYSLLVLSMVFMCVSGVALALRLL